jgi:urea transporter
MSLYQRLSRLPSNTRILRQRASRRVPLDAYRFLSATKSNENRVAVPSVEEVTQAPYSRAVSVAESVAETSLTGIGQVIFLNSPKCGAILLASLAFADPYLATLAATGAACSTLTALQSNLDPQKTTAGLLSYNGALVGCATAVFIVPVQSGAFATAAAVTAVGAVATTYLSTALPHYFTKQPQWTYSFNIVTLSMLLRQYHVQQVAVDTTSVVEAAVSTIASPSLPTAVDLLLGSSLTSLSQIFVVNNGWTGLGVAVAIASYSPALAAHALAGAAMGSATGYLGLAAPAADVAAGLWGYNGALTSMAVAVFGAGQNSRSSTNVVALSAAGAATSSLLLGACSWLPVPALTVPFCLTSSILYPLLLENRLPGLGLAKEPHSPERNLPL